MQSFVDVTRTVFRVRELLHLREDPKLYYLTSRLKVGF